VCCVGANQGRQPIYCSDPDPVVAPHRVADADDHHRAAAPPLLEP
jgi:hypothetical protein